MPGRAGVEPQIALAYSSAGGDGVLGVGFSITGASAITRCPKTLAQDGEIREIRYDDFDALCLEGRRLVAVGHDEGIIEYRTVPDTFVKVIGHDPDEGGTPRSFEALTAEGLTIEYGATDATRPLATGGVPRAWLATVARNGRGQAMDFGYCFADASDHTAEYALDEIRYTRSEGSAALEASRAVKLVYGTKDPADIRTIYSRGMQLQSSLQLDEIQMVGPEEELVRRYAFSYDLSPTTSRTLLMQVEECASDGVCKPPTRFQYKSDAPGFKRIKTGIAAPTSKLASPLLFDIDGDGLDDLVVPDTNPALSTPQNPVTDWLIAKNHGQIASPPYFSKAALAFSQKSTNAGLLGSSDPALIQPELGTASDYDQNGRGDIWLHDVYGTSVNETVLLAQPDQTFEMHDTGLRRPFPLNAVPEPPALSSPGGAVHLADLDGDGVPDRIQCQDHSAEATDVPGEPVWTAHLWKPAKGSAPAGFGSTGEAIEPLAGYACNVHLYTVDINADGKVDLVVPSVLTVGGTDQVPALTYNALSRRSDGSYGVVNTNLPIRQAGSRIVFLDVNGDGLPDAVVSGSSDHRLHTYLNTGRGFAALPADSLYWDGIGEQDTYFHLAVPLDYDGDGRSDLLVPIPGEVWPNVYSTLPGWFMLRATGAQDGPTFTAADPKIPFGALLGDEITLAHPAGPRVGDVNGDGAADVVLVLDGVFNVFQNLAADQDLLVGVSDGMNAYEPDDPSFAPNVSISYGHLTDAWITHGAAADDPALESYLYLSHADASNDCAYPRRCAVGPRRVVSGYALSDESGGSRHYGVRYRDGRYHRLGHGFLGFGERLITDLDTGAGTADFYDNSTFDEDLAVFPFAGQVQRQRRWFPRLPSQPKTDPIVLSFTDITRTVVPTSDGASYFTRSTESRLRRMQGLSSPFGSPSPSVEAYVEHVATKGGALVLRDTTVKVTDVDEFGNVLGEQIATSGVDLTLRVERTFKNDTSRWVLGQLQSQKECSTASMLSQCRTLTRTTTLYGEVETEAIADDKGSPETQLKVVYERDGFGNVTNVTAEDAFGHHRSSTVTYEPEGISRAATPTRLGTFRLLNSTPDSECS